MAYREQQSSGFYFIAQVILVIIFNALFNFKAYKTWRVPAEGGFIVASNHQSYIDPPAVGCCLFQKHLFFMARDNIFRIPVLGRVISWLGAFPIKRGKFDMRGMNIMIKLLKTGHAVVMFPEGTRTFDGELLKLQPGIGIIAHKAKVPVLPVYLEGFFKAWPRFNVVPRFFKKLRIIYGKPIDFSELYKQKPSGSVYRAITDRIESEINRLKNELHKM